MARPIAQEPRSVRRRHFNEPQRITLLEDDADEFETAIDANTAATNKQTRVLFSILIVLLAGTLALAGNLVAGMGG